MKIIKEGKSVTFGKEGRILIIQVGENNLLQDRAVLQWFKLVDCILEK